MLSTVFHSLLRKIEENWWYINCTALFIFLGCSGTESTKCPTVPAPDDDGWLLSRGNWSTLRKLAPVPLCPLKIPHDMSRARIPATAVGSRRLTAWATARPDSTVTTPSLKLFNNKQHKISTAFLAVSKFAWAFLRLTLWHYVNWALLWWEQLNIGIAQTALNGRLPCCFNKIRETVYKLKSKCMSLCKVDFVICQYG
jgi:hypothetical protein